MSKPLLGLALGAVLGLVDGASAYLYPYPDVKAAIAGIMIGSTFKGLVTGLAMGFFARKFRSLPAGILLGLAIGLLLSYLVALMSPSPEGKYYFAEIILPGSALGAIVGFATQRFGVTPAPSRA